MTNIDQEKQQSLTLQSKDLRFITHFIRSYNSHWIKGEFDEAHHCAAAIVLFISDLLGESADYDN